MLVHEDRPHGALVFVDHQDLVAVLEDLEGERHVVGARHAGTEALQLRVTRVEAVRIVGDLHEHAVLEVVLLLLERLGLIRDGAALDDAHARGLGTPRAHDVVVRTGLGVMGFDVPVRRVDRLPDPIQVRLAVFRARALRGRGRTRRCRLTSRCRRRGLRRGCLSAPRGRLPLTRHRRHPDDRNHCEKRRESRPPNTHHFLPIPSEVRRS